MPSPKSKKLNAWLDAVSQKNIEWPVILALSALFSYLFVVAWRLKIDYADSFETLSSTLAYVLRNDYTYLFKRPLTLSGVLTPFLLLEEWFRTDGLTLLVAHLLAVTIFLFTSVVVYKIFRLHLQPQTAWIGTFLFTLNRLLIHQAPFIKEDIAGTLFTTLAFYFYLVSLRTNKISDFLKTGVCIGLAMDQRRNLIPLFAIVITLYELASRQTQLHFSPVTILSVRGKSVVTKILLLIFFPVLFLLTLPAIAFPIMRHATFWAAPAKFVSELFLEYRLVSYHFQSAFEPFIFIYKSLTWPLVLLALTGLLLEIKKKSPGTLFHLIWLGSFLFFACLVLYQKESRYLFPLFPPLYFFVARGFEETLAFLNQRMSSKKLLAFVKASFIVFVVSLPASTAVAECLKFRNPLYTTDFYGKVFGYAKKLVGDHVLYWFGSLYAVYPKDYVFDRRDEYTYFYHSFSHVAGFYTKKKARGYSKVTVAQPINYQEGLFFRPPIADTVENGDVLIVNPDPGTYWTSNATGKILPLVVQRVRTCEFSPAVVSPEGAILYRSTQLSTAQIETRITEKGYEIQGIGIPDGDYEIHVLPDKIGKPIYLGSTRATNGQFVFSKLGAYPALNKKRLLLFGYDSVKVFAPIIG